MKLTATYVALLVASSMVMVGAENGSPEAMEEQIHKTLFTSVKKCGRDLMQTIDVACTLYDEFVQQEPTFDYLIDEVDREERLRHGEDPLVPLGVTERCCRRTCKYIEMMLFCISTEQKRAGGRARVH